jgi:hypothetical protein
MEGLLPAIIGPMADCLCESHQRFLEWFFERELELAEKRSDAALKNVDLDPESDDMVQIGVLGGNR